MPLSPALRMALVLGLLSAVGPFAIDMYLPALPVVGQSLQARVGAVQWSLTALFLALGVGQVVYGPVSDMLGRKPPLYFGLALFCVTSVGCALAGDIRTLVALLMLVFSVSPLPAPLMGSGMAAGLLASALLTWTTLRPAAAPLPRAGRA